MHMAALNVVRFNESVFVQFYNRIYNRSKIKMKGYVAVQKKLLCLIYALWKSDSVYQRDYAVKTNQIHEPETHLSSDPAEPEMEVATNRFVATQDRLPCIQPQEAFFPEMQI